MAVVSVKRSICRVVIRGKELVVKYRYIFSPRVLFGVRLPKMSQIKVPSHCMTPKIVLLLV